MSNDAIATVAAEVKSAKVKASKSKDAKQKSHPGFHAMVVESISALKDRTGSSLPAIKKFVGDKYGKDLPANHAKIITMTIRRMVSGGYLVQVKGSFKLGEKEKQVLAKKDKKPVVKKSVEKKANSEKSKSTKVATKPKGEKKKAAKKDQATGDKHTAKIVKKKSSTKADKPAGKKATPKKEKKTPVKKAAPKKAEGVKKVKASKGKPLKDGKKVVKKVTKSPKV